MGNYVGNKLMLCGTENDMAACSQRTDQAKAAHQRCNPGPQFKNVHDEKHEQRSRLSRG